MKNWILGALVLLAAGCSGNANLALQMSKATSEADAHAGVILYSGFDFQLVRVRINGVDYIANSKGGLVRETP